MDRVKIIRYKNNNILKIDYSNCNEKEMMDIVNHTRDIILVTNEKILALSIFNDKNYGTPNFIRHLERELPKYDHLIKKQAVTGLNNIQIWILKGINLWTKSKLYHFDSTNDAMGFLVKE